MVSFQPLLGKKRWALLSSGPCYQDCWHTGFIGSSIRQVAMLISLRYSAACTGLVCRSAYLSSLSLWYRPTCASVDLDRPTWPTSFSRSPGFPVDNACGHRRRRHRTSLLSDCPLSATELYLSPRRQHETVCQLKLRHQIPCTPSKPN